MPKKSKNNTPKFDITKMRKNAKEAESLLKVLANSSRLMILCHLVNAEKSVGELVELVDLSQSSVSQHLSKMKDLKFVEDDKRGQEVFYRIDNKEVREILLTLYNVYCK